VNAAKPFTIPKKLVYEAWKIVKTNAGSAGVDKETIDDFEKDLKNNLYRYLEPDVVGSYFPPPVESGSHPKKNAGERILGCSDCSGSRWRRWSSNLFLNRLWSQSFAGSYGYRPEKSALDAVEITRKRCWEYDWVLEFDIKGLFDNIDHALLLRALENTWIANG